MSSRAPVLFVSHGGGPLPLLGDPGHQGMVDAFVSIEQRIRELPAKQAALLYISAHWEAAEPVITSAASPSLYFDYYGFPPESYSYRYPVPGAPEIAADVAALLDKAGFNAHLDPQRGLDHGVFVPGLMLLPEADIPTFQLSLLSSLDPQQHWKLGEALRELSERNVMIIGSGFSFHNMRAFFGPASAQGHDLNEAFEQWLSEALALQDADARRQALVNWEQAPGARYCHPREEHLMPLLVCAAAAGTVYEQHWQFSVLGKQGSCYWWS
ncbi:MAG TPA: class III extradiol ring-cleavage dioxygenase [Pseudohongiella sp.]|nr:class III extradiol ring-cleavage dioxygenase [Pseudohongiella sp.]